MIFSRADLPPLRSSLLVFIGVLLVCFAAIAASKRFASHAQHEQQDAMRQLVAARGLLATAEEDRKNMRSYTFEYGELLKRNIIGDGQRLNWIEALETIRKQHRVLDFRYSISPQHDYAPPEKLDSGNFALNRSDMTLQFDLLHEGQLMDFFDVLRTSTGGWFILDHCAMERNADSGAAPQLKAECTGGWLTLTNKSAK